LELSFLPATRYGYLYSVRTNFLCPGISAAVNTRQRLAACRMYLSVILKIERLSRWQRLISNGKSYCLRTVADRWPHSTAQNRLSRF